ncbi:MAG: hypothetical protein PHE15_05180 [Dehalococcoidales bacterium]|nr:hypothetical protein [Dehalococcoidales bacterium]
MSWKYLKSKQFLLTWLVLYLLIPTFWYHQLFMTYEARGTVYLFAGSKLVYFLFDQLFSGDFGDTLVVFLFILPLVIYTFILSVLVHFIYLKIKQKRNTAG